MAKTIVKKDGIAFACGNFYKFYQVNTYDDGRIYLYGYRWIKSRKTFSKQSLIHYVGDHYEEIDESQLPK